MVNFYSCIFSSYLFETLYFQTETLCIFIIKSYLCLQCQIKKCKTFYRFNQNLDTLTKSDMNINKYFSCPIFWHQLFAFVFILFLKSFHSHKEMEIEIYLVYKLLFLIYSNMEGKIFSNKLGRNSLKAFIIRLSRNPFGISQRKHP